MYYSIVYLKDYAIRGGLVRLGSTVGDHFGTSEPPWRTVGPAVWTRSGPEQDFHRFWRRDLISRAFWAPRLEMPLLFSSLFPGNLFNRFLRRISTVGLQIQGFRKESIAKMLFSQTRFMDFSVNVCFCLEALGTVCLF